MNKISPPVFGLACGTGVAASNYILGSDLSLALLAGGVTGAVVALVLFFWRKPQG